jgi:predicted transglutaminase-like cysteine proteinase
VATDLGGQPVSLRWRPWLLAALVGGLALLSVGSARPGEDGAPGVAFDRHALDARNRVVRWRALLDDLDDRSELEQLALVNEFFNLHVRFADDREIWGVADYWATPLEALERGYGDCEDYSVAKYITLGLLGVPIERLRITYVRADTAYTGAAVPQAHMVLAYYPAPGAQPLILDNLVNQLLPASARPDLQPVFGFNSEGRWVAGIRAAADPTARLSRWRDLLRRLGQESLR